MNKVASYAYQMRVYGTNDAVHAIYNTSCTSSRSQCILSTPI